MIEFIVGVLSLIIIICFFILCSNIKQLRCSIDEHFIPSNTLFRVRFYTLLACGKKEEAENVLVNKIIEYINSSKNKGFAINDEKVLAVFSNYIALCNLQIDIELLKQACMADYEYKKYVKAKENVKEGKSIEPINVGAVVISLVDKGIIKTGAEMIVVKENEDGSYTCSVGMKEVGTFTDNEIFVKS